MNHQRSTAQLKWATAPARGDADPIEPGRLTLQGVPSPDRHGDLLLGDARRALPALLAHEPERTAGQARLVYIDPPFNTGELFGDYDDRLSRTEWLSLFSETVEQLHAYVHPLGSIWVHLNDAEQHRARCVLDDVFGESSFVGTIIWQKRLSRESRTAFSSMHDYIHVYAPAGPREWKHHRNGLPDPGEYSNPDNDPRGPWRSSPMTVQDGHATPQQFYTLITPTGASHNPPPGRCWTYTQDRVYELDRQGRIYWPRGGAGKPRLKVYERDSRGVAPFTIWPAEEVGTTASAKKELLRTAAGKATFATPKPESLLERVVHIATDPGDLVVDSFLGSGTTALAAERLGRRWIGVERNEATVRQYVQPRLERAGCRAEDVNVWRVH